MNRRWALAGFLGLAGLPLVSVAASSDPFGFALTLERYELQFAVPDRAVNSVNEKVGITLWEPAQPQLILGLTLGQLFLTQTDYPTVAGRDFNGYFVDLTATRVVAESGPMQYFGAAAYGYQQVGDPNSNNSVRWHTLRFSGGTRAQVSDAVALTAAISYGALRGTENTAGLSPRTTQFEETKNLGGSIGVDLNVDPGGYVGLSVEGGAHHGVSLTFARRY